VLLSTLDGSAIGQDSNLVVRPDEGVIIAPADLHIDGANASFSRRQQ
jgi:hypothetical protein